MKILFLYCPLLRFYIAKDRIKATFSAEMKTALDLLAKELKTMFMQKFLSNLNGILLNLLVIAFQFCSETN